LLNADGTYKGGYEYTVAIGPHGWLLFVMGDGAASIVRLFRPDRPTTEEDAEFANQPAATPTAWCSFIGSGSRRRVHHRLWSEEGRAVGLPGLAASRRYDSS
jgi:hypothetical protein